MQAIEIRLTDCSWLKISTMGLMDLFISGLGRSNVMQFDDFETVIDGTYFFTENHLVSSPGFLKVEF